MSENNETNLFGVASAVVGFAMIFMIIGLIIKGIVWVLATIIKKATGN
jgi:hypothetical protein